MDHRYVQHTLQANAWVLAVRRAAGDQVVDWLGDREARLEVPTKPVARNRASPIGADDIRSDGYERVRGLQGEFGRVCPDAALVIAGPRLLPKYLLVEFDRTARPSRLVDKLWRYDALITAWWKRAARLSDSDEPPTAVFVSPDDQSVSALMETASRHLTGTLAQPGVSEDAWPSPGRDQIVFAAERHVHDGSLVAWRLPARPANGSDSSQLLPVETTLLRQLVPATDKLRGATI